MSDWNTVYDDDIVIDKGRQEVDILVTQNDFGNVYLTLSFDQVCRIFHDLPSDSETNGEQAPPNSLPSWKECSLRVHNSDFIAKRVAQGGYGNEDNVKVASHLHRFIYEYDDANPYRSAWFLHRLELVLQEARAAQPTTVAQHLYTEHHHSFTFQTPRELKIGELFYVIGLPKGTVLPPDWVFMGEPAAAQPSTETNALKHMANIFQYWLDFQDAERKKEGIPTDDETYVMRPPSWPSRGTLKEWIKALSPPTPSDSGQDEEAQAYGEQCDDASRILHWFLADLENEGEPKFDELADRCEKVGIVVNPCPLCGKYGEHVHEM